MRDVGKEIPNAKITLSDCIPEGSEATLKSIRYVEGKALYYMDYMAEVDWQDLLTQPADQHFSYPCLKSFTDKVSMALFGAIPGGEVSNPGGSCSGFICTNSKGEMLHGRNYDGDVGEMVVVFNKNVKPGEHKSVMMTDLNVVQQLSGDMRYNYRDSALLKPGQELNALLRQPLFALDGMNDAGLVISCYQLPNFYTGTPEQVKQESGEFPYDDPNGARRPRPIQQESGKPQAGFMGLHNMALTKCTTVDEVIDLFKSYDFVTLDAGINLHWCVTD